MADKDAYHNAAPHLSKYSLPLNSLCPYLANRKKGRSVRKSLKHSDCDRGVEISRNQSDVVKVAQGL